MACRANLRQNEHPWEYSNDHTATVKILKEILYNTKAIRYYYCVWLYDHMPVYKIFKLHFSKSYNFKGDKKIKKQSMDIYTNARTPTGFYYSCKLPKLMLTGVGGTRELYFKEIKQDTPF